MQEVNYYMTRYNIMMEDINMVILDLAIAIMYYRVTSGPQSLTIMTLLGLS